MNIIIAGAGHGGLVAGARLAKAGHSVTVYEKLSRDRLGHDWEDRFTFDLLLKETDVTELNDDEWRYRGDCAFVSPDYNSRVVINYTDENRQKIMWRKALIERLLHNAEKNGVKFVFDTEITGVVVKENAVVGIKTADEEIFGDMVIDAAGAFSPVRMNLPSRFGIEKEPDRGDVFYAYRAYYDKKDPTAEPEVPFEVYLCHAGEQGLSWCCTNSDSVDILIGRIDPLKKDELKKHIDNFRSTHPWTGDKILHGGNYGIIPVRRPLALMIADGYAAVGDSAFMTTPMNGMGIDLSISAGGLLADTINRTGRADAVSLWAYNRDFQRLYGGDTAKNESLKNSLLNLPAEGVDFLFKNEVIQASDLSGAGRNTNIASLSGKFRRGMKNPKYFFEIINGLMNGAKLLKALKSAPEKYDKYDVLDWQQRVADCVLKVTRE